MFQACANTFLYMVKVSGGTGGTGLPIEGYNDPGAGLPGVATPSSATDADIELTADLIKGAKKFSGVTELNDGTGGTAQISDVIDDAIKGLSDYDINTVAGAGTDGQWAMGSHTGWSEPSIQDKDKNLFDYVNFDSVQTILNYSAGKSDLKAAAVNIKGATTKLLTYLTGLIKNPTDFFTKSRFGPDDSCCDLRLMQNLGEYLISNTGKTPEAAPFYSSIKPLLTNILGVGFSTKDPNPLHGGGNVYSFYGQDSLWHVDIRGFAYQPDGANQMQQDGCMMIAMMGLGAAGVTSLPTLGVIGGWAESTISSFQYDMETPYSSPSSHQPLKYFDCAVGLDCLSFLCGLTGNQKT